MKTMEQLGAQAKQASKGLASAPAAVKNKALSEIARQLVLHMGEILSENQRDLAAAEKNGMSSAMLDRLRLTEQRIRGMADGVLKIVELDDPIGGVDEGTVRPNGLVIHKTRVPLGVIGIIFESRPNVTVDAAALCLKAGNAVILRGGKEAIHSNLSLCGVMQRAVGEAGLDPMCVQLVEDTSRESAAEMMKLNGYLDVLIPRGGAGLINAVVNTATVPVIQTGVGNCHVYVDKTADLAMAARIVNNAKTSRPSVCNAEESLLVHKDVAEQFLPMVKKLLDQSRVELRGCPETVRILGDEVVPASEEDYAAEFLDYILAVKVVGSLDEAIAHIGRYGTGHSECIVTNDLNASQQFQAQVDAAAVYVNASTRYTDGGEFGFGAEIGISTQKLHARGPMGLRELTSVKYVIHGTGQIRE